MSPGSSTSNEAMRGLSGAGSVMRLGGGGVSHGQAASSLLPRCQNVRRATAPPRHPHPLHRADHRRPGGARRRRRHAPVGGARVGGVRLAAAGPGLGRARRPRVLVRDRGPGREHRRGPRARSSPSASRTRSRRATRSAASRSTRIGIDFVLLNGTDTATLQKGPGRYPADPPARARRDDRDRRAPDHLRGALPQDQRDRGRRRDQGRAALRRLHLHGRRSTRSSTRATSRSSIRSATTASS